MVDRLVGTHHGDAPGFPVNLEPPMERPHLVELRRRDPGAYQHVNGLYRSISHLVAPGDGHKTPYLS